LIRESLNKTEVKKECALCECSLPENSELNLCNECIKSADCCVGLEKLHG
jgi:hypothetical protein